LKFQEIFKVNLLLNICILTIGLIQKNNENQECCFITVFGKYWLVISANLKDVYKEMPNACWINFVKNTRIFLINKKPLKIF